MYLNFTRAFETAWERMMIILFRPFDLGKWFVIGFSAFLAGLLTGGNGINLSYNGNSFPRNEFRSSASGVSGTAPDLHQLNEQLRHALVGVQLGMIIFICLVIFIFFVALTLLLIWLGSRGQFMFLDNIVRNRAEVALPWRLYARPANSLFIFYALLSLLAFFLFVPFLVVGILMAVPYFHANRWPAGGEIGGFLLLGAAYVCLSIGVMIVLFVFREFGIPIMFRQGLSAQPAFVAAMKLIGAYPGSIAVFILLRMAIFLGVAVLCVVLCCVTCCIGTLPYLGTVILLPALIFVRCFTLDCLSQFGPAYDAFTVDAPGTGPGHGLPPTPPLPRG